jgi:hypothetical protein
MNKDFCLSRKNCVEGGISGNGIQPYHRDKDWIKGAFGQKVDVLDRNSGPGKCGFLTAGQYWCLTGSQKEGDIALLKRLNKR